MFYQVRVACTLVGGLFILFIILNLFRVLLSKKSHGPSQKNRHNPQCSIAVFLGSGMFVCTSRLCNCIINKAYVRYFQVDTLRRCLL